MLAPTLVPMLASAIPDLTPILPGLIFYVLAGLAVVAAITAATASKIVHAAFGLMAAFFGVAGLYALLGSDLLALIQIVVYVGGILILLVFGVLLTGRAKSQLGLERPQGTGIATLVGATLLLGLLLAIGSSHFEHGTPQMMSDLPEPQPTTQAIGRALLDTDQYLLPFELVSVFLLAALVGSAYLVRRRRDGT
jgi:NADH:ubiquinone oxidoreductase subunit 6 (subunit J)